MAKASARLAQFIATQQMLQYDTGAKYAGSRVSGGARLVGAFSAQSSGVPLVTYVALAFERAEREANNRRRRQGCPVRHAIAMHQDGGGIGAGCEKTAMAERNLAVVAGENIEAEHGDGWLAAVHPEDRDEAARLWRDAITRKVPYAAEHRLHRADGSWRTMAMRVAETGGSEGRPVMGRIEVALLICGLHYLSRKRR